MRLEAMGQLARRLVPPALPAQDAEATYQPQVWRLPALPLAVWGFALVAVIGSWLYLPNGGRDWSADIAPAARAWWPAPWLEGLPLLPWAALLLSPLGALPDRIATALLNGASVIALALVLKRLGGSPWLVFPLLISPMGYWLFTNGQTDTLILAGLLFFNGLDPLILVLKPQVAVGAIVARLRRAGARWWAYLAPLAVVGVLSLVVWWGWPAGLLAYRALLVSGDWNSAVWPFGLPFGLALLWWAWRTGDDRFGIVATPLLFPYVNMPSYLGLLAVLAVRWPRWALVAWVAMLGLVGWLVLKL
jgi:hypothetical protein